MPRGCPFPFLSIFYALQSFEGCIGLSIQPCRCLYLEPCKKKNNNSPEWNVIFLDNQREFQKFTYENLIIQIHLKILL